MLLETIAVSAASALFPALIDGAKGLFNKWTGGATSQPANFQEFLQLENFNLEKLKTLAGLDNPSGTPSQWVVDLRASTRYVAVIMIILNAIVVGAFKAADFSVNDEYVMVAYQMANSAFFFLFGDRVYMNLKPGIGRK